jgi:outer membrane protein
LDQEGSAPGDGQHQGVHGVTMRGLAPRLAATAWGCWATSLLCAHAMAQGAAPEVAAPADAPEAAVATPEQVAPPPPTTPFRYQVGAALSFGPTYTGSATMGLSLRPVTYLQWGRLRLSSSKAGLVEAPADAGRSSGASLSLTESTRWSTGVGLRTDHGRSSADDPRLAGLPDVKATLRGRAYAAYRFEGRAEDSRGASLALSTDLLQRGGGTVLSFDLSRQVRWTPAWRWSHGLGLKLADGSYMRSYHGVSAEAAAASGLPAYRPGAGLADLHAGTGLTWRLDPRWRVGAALNMAWQMGPVAASPLTERRFGYGLALGLIYISQDD